MSYDLEMAGNDIANLFEQLADLQERVKAYEDMFPLILESLQGLANDNATTQQRLTISHLKQLRNIQSAYGMGGEPL
jgi:hypothetical protein